MIGKVDIVRIKLKKERSIFYGATGKRKLKITKPRDVVKMASSLFDGADKEMVYVCVLDGNMKPINISLVTIGSMNNCTIHLAEIFKTAILSNCPNIICLHNHPSGSVEPSDEDRIATLKMQYIGKLLGIKLQDHIIVGENGNYYSFQKDGILSNADWLIETELAS